MRIDVSGWIENLPISAANQMRIERTLIKVKNEAKLKINKPEYPESKFYPLTRGNRLYSHEELLRKFSGVNENLYAVIEHGLYFGKNHQKVYKKHDYDLGCILTGGLYRKEIINEYFPDYYCETVGPMIHYAPMDESYYREIKDAKLDGKTLLFFPMHGNDFFRPEYDAKATLNRIIEIAKKYDCVNILICVFHSEKELFSRLAEELSGKEKIIIVTCGGRYNISFLARQKAIIHNADLTISNSLGTHLGYCVYYGKPHILLRQDFVYTGNQAVIRAEMGSENRSSNWKNDMEEEVDKFEKTFNPGCSSLTEEQIKLCDYYWGFSQIRSPDEIKDIYHECRRFSQEFMKKAR